MTTAPTEAVPLVDRFRGCLLGGAVGDALGADAEFRSLGQIRLQHGPDGVTDFVPAYGRTGAITDDTQMTLFTAEGLIRAQQRFRDRGICNVPGVVYRAYLRWLMTQGDATPSAEAFSPTGWLISLRELHSRRAPGNTCLSALRSGRAGSVADPINDSKGCGTVMRIAPVGLVALEPFKLGCDVSVLTHGHPSGYLAGGFLAQMIAKLRNGASLEASIEAARAQLLSWPGHEECTSAVDSAVALAASTSAPRPEDVEALGAGWVAEEALAIGLFCALVAEDFRSGVLLAVNHGGDSDSTGAIAGNILGVHLGVGAIPTEWLDRLELRDQIDQLARDLHAVMGTSGERDSVDFERYPPN